MEFVSFSYLLIVYFLYSLLFSSIKFLSIKGDSNDDNKHDEMDNYTDDEAKISEDTLSRYERFKWLIY